MGAAHAKEGSSREKRQKPAVQFLPAVDQVSRNIQRLPDGGEWELHMQRKEARTGHSDNRSKPTGFLLASVPLSA